MSDDDELGDFEDYGQSSEDSENDSKAQNARDEGEQNAQDDELRDALGEANGRLQEAREEADRRRPVGPDNPTGVDPRPGKWDLCYDNAKPGAKVYVVDVLAESVEEYNEEFEDAPPLDDYEGNVLSQFSRADRVLAAIYVKDSLTSVSYTAYPMPESRLTRLPAEEASLVGGGGVEFARPPVEDDDADHRLSGAEPAQSGGPELTGVIPETHYFGKTAPGKDPHLFDEEESRSLCGVYNTDGVRRFSPDSLPVSLCGKCVEAADYLEQTDEEGV